MKINLIKIILLIVGMNLIACNNIVLKKYTIETPPFKLGEGEYSLNIYEIKYPNTLEEKETFFNELDIFVNKIFIQEKKYTLLLSEEYYKDYDRLKLKGILKEEEIFEKTASSLTKSEREELEKITNEKVERHENTVQKYLNLQVYHLKKVLGYDDYDPNAVYTELYKENIINELKKKRQNTILISEKIDVTYLVNIEEAYNGDESIILKEDEYYYTKNINFIEKRVFSDIINNYTNPIYIKNIAKDDLNILIDKKENIKSSCIIIYNDFFKGYRYNKNTYYFFLGGLETVQEYENYQFTIDICLKSFEEILESEEEYTLMNFIGGK
ncbi:MAG: hypothetical protein GX287_05700 [Fusobacteria bacterium]|nr:hypothetical protein [Fusobacteriota bacterium]